MRYPVRLFVLAAAILAFSSTSLRAAAPLADRIPAGAEVYIGWRGSPLSWHGYKSSHLQAILRDDQLPAVLKTYIQNLILHLGESQPQAGVLARMVWVPAHALWNSKAAVYLDGVDRTYPGMAMPRVGILVKGSPAANRRLMRTFTSLSTLLNAQAAAGRPLAVVGKSAGSVYLLIDPTAKMRALAKAAGPGSIVANTKFKNCLQKVGGSGGVVGFMDIKRAASAVGLLQSKSTPNAHESFPALMHRLHLDRLGDLGFSVGFANGNMKYSAYVSMSPARHPAKPDAQHALMMAMLHDVPAGATSVEIGGNRIATLVNGCVSLVSADPQSAQQLKTFLNNINKAVGFRIRRDFIDALGTTSLIYCDPAFGGNSGLATVWEFRPPHPKRISSEIADMVRLVNRKIARHLHANGSTADLSIRFKVLRVSSGGAVIHYVDSPYVSPAWCVDGHRLMFAMYPQILMAALKQVQEPGADITANLRFIRLVKELGGVNRISSLDFENLHAQARGTYLQVLVLQRSLFGFGDIMVAPSPGMLLPPFQQIEKELTVSGSKTWLGSSGWHWEAISPFPGSSVFCPNSILGSLSGPEISNEAMMIAILLPSLAKAKELANRAVSAANESGIIRQCIAYSQRHGGNLPPNLAVLVADGYVTPRALVSPGSGLSPADITMPKPGNHLNLIAVAKQLAGHLSYSYFGQGVDLNDLTDPSELAVIFDVSELHHKHGCTVGFADGHVLWVPELQIPALVAQQNAYRQKHHLPLLP